MKPSYVISITLIILVVIAIQLMKDIPDAPANQLRHYAQWQKLKKQYGDSENLVKEKAIEKRARTFFETDMNVINWVAKVDEFKDWGDDVWIEAEYRGIEYNLHPSDAKTEVAIGRIKAGDWIRFTGVMSSESSFTMSGAIKKPEMTIRVCSVDKIKSPITNQSSSNCLEKKPTVNFSNELSQKELDIAKRAFAIFDSFCHPLMGKYRSDIVSIGVGVGFDIDEEKWGGKICGNYQCSKYGWKKQIYIGIKIKDETSVIPKHLYADRQRLHFYLGGSQKPGIDTTKRPQLCGYPKPPGGLNSFMPVPELAFIDW